MNIFVFFITDLLSVDITCIKQTAYYVQEGECILINCATLIYAIL